jgi:hypothetical protein
LTVLRRQRRADLVEDISAAYGGHQSKEGLKELRRFIEDLRKG